MKTMKRMMSLVIALILAVAMAVPAMAANEGGSIQISGTAVNTTYELYKVFEIETVNGSYFYKPTANWKAFFTKSTTGTSPNGTLYGTVAENGYIVWLNQSLFDSDPETSGVAAAAFAKHAQEYATGLTADVTAVADSTTLTITGLEQNAYYLLVSSLGGTAMAGPIGTETLAITEKNDVGKAPTIVKTVGPNNAELMSVDLGTSYSYKLVATLNEAITGTVTITDVAPKYITVDATSVQVYKGSTLLTKDTDYTFGHVDGTNTYSHVFTFNSGFSAGETLTITYNATLGAASGTLPTTHEMYANRATLEYGEKSVFDTASVFTLAVNGYKYYTSETGASVDLPGAKFVLKNADNKYYKLDGNIVTWVDSQADATVLTSDNNGDFSFFGIAMGEYTLVETEAPTGYVKADDISITVNRDLDEVKVENVKGSGKLPETGGIGTTIFYAVGGVLVLGALSLLIVRKRTSAK